MQRKQIPQISQDDLKAMLRDTSVWTWSQWCDDVVLEQGRAPVCYWVTEARRTLPDGTDVAIWLNRKLTVFSDRIREDDAFFTHDDTVAVVGGNGEVLDGYQFDFLMCEIAPLDFFRSFDRRDALETCKMTVAIFATLCDSAESAEYTEEAVAQ